MKKNLNTEIGVRERRHREEMLNLDRNLEGKSTEEAMEMLDGMDERAQGLIGCIDEKMERLEREDKITDRIAWVVMGSAIIFIVLGSIVGWLMGWIR